MPGGYLTGRRAGPVLIVALVLAVALMVGFRSWGGVAAAGLRGVAAAYGGAFAPLVRGTGAGDAAPSAGPGGGGFWGRGGTGFGCCAGGPGGCGFWGRSGAAWAGGSGPDLKALEQAALEVYREQTGDTGPVRVQVRDFGCHLQADVYKDGRLVESYIYRYGQWQEID
ncbi:MAG: hypothetical protein QME70_03480 [Bacillota bacterium]|nr:hypothetical protein [Bacillota bacterium]